MLRVPKEEGVRLSEHDLARVRVRVTIIRSNPG